MRESTRRRLFLVLLALFLCPQMAQAYLGPGAGFTIVSTFFVLFAALASAFAVLLTWPFRWVLKLVFRRRRAGVGQWLASRLIPAPRRAWSFPFLAESPAWLIPR